MRIDRYKSIVVFVAVVALLGVACTKKTPTPGATGGTVESGGTFRVQEDEFPWESGYGFDPTVEYVGDNWDILAQLLVRRLTSYKWLPNPEGAEVIPDMAESLGAFSNGDKTITYNIKSGIKFGEPINREITAQDFITAFERLGTPELTAGGYASYYVPLIEGMQKFADGKAKSISGIKAPDDHTIVFTLTSPTPDWDARMAMPAAGPIPAEAAKCFKEYASYGNYVVSSGPYEIEGMDAVDFSNCNKLKAPSGFKLDDHLDLVRNQSYDQKTDDATVRPSLIDRFEWRKNKNVGNSFDKVERGEIEMSYSSAPSKVVRKYTVEADLKPYLHSASDNATWYISMNLATPPFDDINVRKAANAVMNKAGLIQKIGGRVRGVVAPHAVPPGLLGGQLGEEYNPYNNAEGTGDLDQAKEFMKLSDYDTDKDGVCDAAACKNLLHVTRETEPFPAFGPIIEGSLNQIGLTFKPTVEAASYYSVVIPAKPIQLASGGGWGPDWPEPYTFYEFTFTGRTISIVNNVNTALVGFTKEIAQTLTSQYKDSGEASLESLTVKPPASPIPSVDADVDACLAKSGDERLQCWIDLDKKIMEDIVPWIPYRWSNNIDITSNAVTQYGYDGAWGNVAWVRLAVDQSKQVGL